MQLFLDIWLLLDFDAVCSRDNHLYLATAIIYLDSSFI